MIPSNFAMTGLFVAMSYTVNFTAFMCVGTQHHKPGVKCLQKDPEAR